MLKAKKCVLHFLQGAYVLFRKSEKTPTAVEAEVSGLLCLPLSQWWAVTLERECERGQRRRGKNIFIVPPEAIVFS